MLNLDHTNDSVLNDFAAGSNDSSVVVVGRAHRTSPGHRVQPGRRVQGKRLPTASLATPAVEHPRAEIASAAEPRPQERWCRRQRLGMSCCLTAAGSMPATGQAPAAIWASLILNQQGTL